MGGVRLLTDPVLRPVVAHLRRVVPAPAAPAGLDAALVSHLHRDHLDLPSYTGFVMPRLQPIVDHTGAIVDVSISYPQDLTTQMLEYSSSHEA